MVIRTRDVPQADVLEDVLKVVQVVRQGTTSYQEISAAIGKVGRQGRYYRRAAEILGFISPAGSNRSALTPTGEAFARASGRDREGLLAKAVLRSVLVQRVLPFLEAKVGEGCSRDELEGFIAQVTERTGPTMIHRRTASVLSWIESIGMLVENANGYYLQRLPPDIRVVEVASDEEPLLPSRYELAEYSEAARRASAARAAIKYVVDDALRERAQRAHRRLTTALAAKMREHGILPRRNKMIDLAAQIGGEPYIFEVKTTTPANVRSQIRWGISQLYDYRYLQCTPSAQLVLVLQNPLPAALRWMGDYLWEDRAIALVWDGNRRPLTCHRRHREELAFLF